jgi:hypothetical protein
MALDFGSDGLYGLEAKPGLGKVKANKPMSWMRCFVYMLFCRWMLSAWPDREWQGV